MRRQRLADRLAPAQDMPGVGHPAHLRLERGKDPVVVVPVEEQRIVMRRGMHRDRHATLPTDLRRPVVDLGGDRELLVRRPFRHPRRRPHRDQRSRKMCHEINPPPHRLEVRGDRVPFGETAVGRAGKADQRQPGVAEAAGKVARPARIGADHPVGDLDPGIAAGRDRRHQIVGSTPPGIAQHLPGERLAPEPELRVRHRHFLIWLRRPGAVTPVTAIPPSRGNRRAWRRPR